MNSNDKLMFFMHFLKVCTGNGDHFILLMKTGNALKERMLSQTITNAFEKC